MYAKNGIVATADAFFTIHYNKKGKNLTYFVVCYGENAYFCNELYKN